MARNAAAFGRLDESASHGAQKKFVWSRSRKGLDFDVFQPGFPIDFATTDVIFRVKSRFSE